MNREKKCNNPDYIQIYRLTHVFLFVDLVLITLLIAFKGISSYSRFIDFVFNLSFYAVILFCGPILQNIEIKRSKNDFMHKKEKIILKFVMRAFLSVFMFTGLIVARLKGIA